MNMAPAFGSQAGPSTTNDPPPPTNRVDPDTAQKVVKLSANATDYLHTLANEPSLGLYYVMEHIHRSVPNLVAAKTELHGKCEQLRGADTDAGFSLEAVHYANSPEVTTIFSGMQSTLNQSIRTAGAIVATRQKKALERGEAQ